MFSKKKPHRDILFDYAALLVLLVLSGILIRALKLQSDALLVATIPVSVGYVIWGVLHHLKHGHIDQKILLEYVSLAVLVNILVAILVW